VNVSKADVVMTDGFSGEGPFSRRTPSPPITGPSVVVRAVWSKRRVVQLLNDVTTDSQVALCSWYANAPNCTVFDDHWARLELLEIGWVGGWLTD